MNEKLQAAITLRKQQEFEKAREILLSLVTQSEDPEVLYLCAITHDNLGLETDQVQAYSKAIQFYSEHLDETWK
jgi:hypothetical protein